MTKNPGGNCAGANLPHFKTGEQQRNMESERGRGGNLRKLNPRRILEERGFRPRKNLGQNFLLDPCLINAIVSDIGLSGNEIALEIGPGTGDMTRALCENAGRVVSVEIDDMLYEICVERLGDIQNLTLIHADALTKNGELQPLVFEEVGKRAAQSGTERICISNLPYSSGTAIIMAILRAEAPFERMLFMIQKEVAERIAAKPGTREYGLLSICVQLWCDVEIVRKVPASAFWPKPEVESALVRLAVDRDRAAHLLMQGPENDSSKPKAAYRQFEIIVGELFATRRKTLGNVVKRMMEKSCGEGACARTEKSRVGACTHAEVSAACPYPSEDSVGSRFAKNPPYMDAREMLREWGFDPSARAETLGVEEIARLVSHLLAAAGNINGTIRGK
ncbi:MAG TPA: 16S rRNA (adenine(1518)-N(6)/adenine(1519)-N(6))-dimethyltransferase RsmA [Candidatus Brocadiia bacterium]|nr:16S rRNA (adenine(1518)-N(6)/adenine(1519)-N(6))-dimethyltransferase RsmA [Candidatus Brocadiia bacterium]